MLGLCDDGTEGWGESCPLGPTYAEAHALGGIAALQHVAPLLIGQNAMPTQLNAAMDAGLEGHRYAKALIDIAAWDILGKRTGLRLCDLLGGAFSSAVPSYFAIRPLSPDEAAAEALRRVEEGYRTLQLKIGSASVAQDAETIRAVYNAVPSDIALAADANRSMRSEDVLHLSRLLQDIPIAFEQPCATPEEMRALKQQINHPLYWDENTLTPGVVLDALGQGHCDGLGMKVTRVGGISAMRAVRDMAIARNVMMSVDDSWGGDIIAAACAHLGATVPPKLFRGTWIAQPFIGSHYDPSGGIAVKNGAIELPNGPGLGVNPDPTLFGNPVLEVSAK